jgi:hypothetical protein
MSAPDVADFLSRWHRIVADRDLTALRDVLADGVSIGAPPYWQRIEGRDVVHHLLGIILHTVEDFTYRREWREGRELALEFTGRAGGLELQGIDLITLDERLAITKLDVLMRPLAAVEKLREVVAPQMSAFLARRAGPDRSTLS